MKNGAQALMQTLSDAGVRVCFTNPGTSEMHFVAALDSEPRMRAVLCLFEGVATGAADGYARMTGQAAATLLHLGCGLGNGLANLHNARKAKVPLLNIVGDHARDHVQHDAPLQSDIETIARNVSPQFVRTSASSEQLCRDAVQALEIAHRRPAQVATLILPADVSWGRGEQGVEPEPYHEPEPPPSAPPERIARIAAVIQSAGRTAMLLGWQALRRPALMEAGRLAQALGVKLLAETFPSRMERGAGLPAVERIAYLGEMASLQLKDFDHLILVDAKAPVSFFAYPGKKSYLVPETCTVHTLVEDHEDALTSLQALVHELALDSYPPAVQTLLRPAAPKGRKLSAEKICKAIGHFLPERSILIDEAISSGLLLNKMTAQAPVHDLITLTGGAIGQGLPSAVGAAIACPDRPVIALVGDGSAMYTYQALWTMAREGLKVITVIFNNAAYAVLNIELQRVGAEAMAMQRASTQAGSDARAHEGRHKDSSLRIGGSQARAQLDLGQPVIHFADLATSLGVKAIRVSSPEAFNSALEAALAHSGPFLIEALVPPALTGLKLKLLPKLLGSLEQFPRPVAQFLKSKIAP